MTIARRLAAALALALTAGSLAVGATPAQAAPVPTPAPGSVTTTGGKVVYGPTVGTSASGPTTLAAPTSCPSTRLCMYVNTGYATDQGYMIWPVQPSGTCEVVNPYRNALSSAWNYSGRNVRFYKNTTCSGTDYRILYNGTGNPKFSTHWSPTWDNSVDAIRWS